MEKPRNCELGKHSWGVEGAAGVKICDFCGEVNSSTKDLTRGNSFVKFWKDLKGWQKFFFVGGVFTFPGIGMMRFSYNPDVGFEEIGLLGVSFAMIGIFIWIFLMIPVAIITRNQRTIPQRAVMITLFACGVLAVVFSSVMTYTILLNIDDYPDVDIPTMLGFYASIDLIFWVPFFILYKKWKLKWNWKKFIPGGY